MVPTGKDTDAATPYYRFCLSALHRRSQHTRNQVWDIAERAFRRDAVLGRRNQKVDKSNLFKNGFVAANNHYAGFGPATANGFRKMIGMAEVVWDEMKQAKLDQ